MKITHRMGNPLNETRLDASVLAAAAARLGFNISDGPRVLDLAAVAITRLAWRDSPVEDWHAVPHSRISDAELMRANVAVTRVVRSLLTDDLIGDGRQLGCDRAPGNHWRDVLTAVTARLTDPGRRLPDGRSLRELAPDAAQFSSYTDHVAHLTGRWAQLSDRLGSGTVVALLACTGAVACPRWWLAPGWPYLVDEFVARLGDPRRWGSPTMTAYVRTLSPPPDASDLAALHQSLLTGPDRLCTAAVRFCLRAGLGNLLPSDYGRPPRQRHALPAGYRALVEPALR